MKIRILNVKAALWAFAAILFFIVSAPYAYPKEITIIYTGNSYSSLYPCGHCPSSVGGGVLRRATALKKLKSEKENTIIIDSGNFTASGAFDTNSINPELDRKRAEIYYQVMEEMGYEAVSIGEAEFSFGQEFLREQIKKSKINYISSNLVLEGVKPYYIKEYPDFKVGLIALSPKDIYRKYGVEAKDYEPALDEVISQIQDECDFIILISSVGDDVNRLIVEKFPMIKFIFASGVFLSSDAYEHLGAVVVFRPSYQAKELRLVDINILKQEGLDWNLSKYKLSLDREEDEGLKSIIPSCFQDQDCPPKRWGLVTKCQNPGSMSSSCEYIEAEKINAAVITDQNCPNCSTEVAENILKGVFPGLQFNVLHYETAQAKDIIKKYGVKALPAFVIDSGISDTEGFEKLRAFLRKAEDKYLFINEVAGIFLYLERKPLEKRIDFFLDFYEEGSEGIFTGLVSFALENEIDLATHFVISDETKTGYPEEEVKAALAVRKVYPQKYSDYISRRIDTIKSASWISILDELKLDYGKIKEVLHSEDINKAFEKNFELAKDLGVVRGNIMLVNNNRIFKIVTLNKKDLKRFFNQTH